MDDWEQARAYALADFEEPHDKFVEMFRATYPELTLTDWVLDLGCGPADVTIRFARAYHEARIIGVDGAKAMLSFGKEAVAQAGLNGRIELLHAYLPSDALPKADYQVIISNSLLHHLADPAALWCAISDYGRTGTRVFVMDLMRPHSRAQAEAFVEIYADGEPEILRRDFFRSLLAAYRPEEIAVQLSAAGFGDFAIEPVSDRHLTITGVCP